MDVQLIMLAAVMGLLYWIKFAYVGYSGWAFTSSPFTVGLIAGLICGNVTQGLILGGTIKLIYLGVISPGGQLPADEFLASACVIPLALTTGMSAEVAVTVAVPIGILGGFLYNVKKIVNCVLVKVADNYAEQANAKGIWRCATLYSGLISVVLSFLPVFLFVLLGQGVVNTILGAIPQWLMHGLEVSGGVLPAIGFAMIMFMIGKDKYIPFFLIGFFVVKCAGVGNLVAAILAISVALIFVVLKREVKEEAADAGE